MFGRNPIFIFLLAASVGIPYAITQQRESESESDSVFQSIGNWFSNGNNNDTVKAAIQAESADPPSGPTDSEPEPEEEVELTVEDQDIQSFNEVLNFNITPSWVIARWPRVTTGLANTRFDSFRVPLVTGTHVSDLAGSLTYYFDKKKKLQRVTFHGYTGDDRRLVYIMTKYFGLKPEPSLGGDIYVARWNRKPKSMLRILRPSVVRRDAPFSHFEVQMELNRPYNYYGMSEQFLNFLDS